MSMRIERQELHKYLNAYLSLVRSGHVIEIIEDNEIIARLLPPEAKPLYIEQLESLHTSLGLGCVPNGVLMSREDSDS
jgi:antitoxin (DNA-binding transcriptional repressor) of toxin-antitoxin stability system